MSKAVPAVLVFAFLGAAPAWAALGEPLASLTRDTQRLQGTVRSTAAAGFSVQEITGDDGMVVREYASPAGEVFAVSWRGPGRPNLVDLLGRYYPAFAQASRATVRRRAPLTVRTGNLVVEMGGAMRSLHGRAYLSDRLPPSVSADLVR